jgi:PKD repeat protein
MKTVISIFLSIIIIIILIISCEKHKDPFSASNKIPTIQYFHFQSTSLKFKKDGRFDLKLKYQDDENQRLTATFKFITGHGDIILPSSFIKKSETINSIVFDAPSEFDTEIDSSLYFIPDTTGKVEIELELSDKVKISTQNAETFFFANTRPVAKFKYTLEGVASPYNLIVDATESYDPDSVYNKYNKPDEVPNQVIEYSWWFDDGTPWIPTTSKTYPHTYLKSGAYTVKLKVIDNDGGVDTTSWVVKTDNQPPVAVLQVNPVKGEAPLTINYTATNSSDPDGKIVEYRIDFDDGTSTLDSIGTHLYISDKNYRVRLQVTDNLGQTDTTGVTVAVATSPVADLNVIPSEGPFPLDCIIDGTDSYDPQGGKLEHDIYIDEKLTYNNVDSVVHVFSDPKTYLVRLIVTSKRNNLTDEQKESVTVINLNPIADFTWYPENPQPLNSVKYTSTSTDSNLTDYISYYKWTFPDGDTLGGKDKSIVFHTFSLDYTPYMVKLEVWDRFDGYDSVLKTIPKK